MTITFMHLHVFPIIHSSVKSVFDLNMFTLHPGTKAGHVYEITEKY